MSSLISLRNVFLLSAVGIMTIAGCGPSPPAIVPVSGTVSINGKPLPNAEVKFMPMQEGLDGNFVASGVTDEKGAFILKMPGQSEPGCCACECKVLIVEGPIPEESRGDDEASILAAGRHRFSQKNRPIPKQLERIGTTPLTYTVSEENKVFDIELTR